MSDDATKNGETPKKRGRPPKYEAPEYLSPEEQKAWRRQKAEEMRARRAYGGDAGRTGKAPRTLLSVRIPGYLYAHAWGQAEDAGMSLPRYIAELLDRDYQAVRDKRLQEEARRYRRLPPGSPGSDIDIEGD